MNWSDRTEEYIKQVRQQMTQLGCLEELDNDNIRFLGDAVELYYRAQDDVDKNGIVVMDQKNRMVQNPAVGLLKSQQQIILAFMKELSLSARQRRLLTRDQIIQEETPLSNLLDELQRL